MIGLCRITVRIGRWGIRDTGIQDAGYGMQDAGYGLLSEAHPASCILYHGLPAGRLHPLSCITNSVASIIICRYVVI